MRLADLEKLCGALNFSTAEAKTYLYDGSYDFRKQTTSLHQSHFPILVYAAFVAAGVKDQDIIPYPIEITQFIAPIMQMTLQPYFSTPSSYEIKQQVARNGNFNKRLSVFLDSKNKDNEDFMAVAVSDSTYPTASHGIRIHLVKKNENFTITMFDSAVGEGIQGDRAAQESPNFLWLRGYITEIIKSNPSYLHSKIEISAKASPHQLDHLCYDHTAFLLAEFILNKMGKQCHFILPEEIDDYGHNFLRKRLYEAHKQTGDVNNKIKPLVYYINISVIKQGLRKSVEESTTESKAQLISDTKMAARMQKEFEQKDRQVRTEHQQLVIQEEQTALNPYRILPPPPQGYVRLSDVVSPQPEDQSNSCCSCIIL